MTHPPQVKPVELCSLQLKTQLSPEQASLSSSCGSPLFLGDHLIPTSQTLPFFFMEGFSESIPLIFP